MMARIHHPLQLARQLVVIALLAAAVAAPYLNAQAGAPPDDPVIDDDNDGVDDDFDDCWDTPEGDLVDEVGCSVCDCDETPTGEAWASHGDYVQCVVAEVKARMTAAAMTRVERRAAVQHAKRSTCGNDELTRCCIFPDTDDEVIVGRCKVVPWDRCDAMIETRDWAEDLDTGSCLPNPCVY
jgi:hypothetical protein